MAKGRLPPPPERPPIEGGSVTVYPPPPLKRIRQVLIKELSSLKNDDNEDRDMLQTCDAFSGRALTYGTVNRSTIEAALRLLDLVEDAVREKDAATAVVRAIDLATMLHQINSESIIKPLLTGFKANLGGNKGRGNRQTKTTPQEALAEFEKVRAEPRFSGARRKGAAEQETADRLGISVSTLRREIAKA